jgi:hypothetical protein
MTVSKLPKPQGRRLPITVLGSGVLCRAIVSLPQRLTDRERPLQERVVFFEAPSRQGAGRHLEKILASVWGVDTADWYEVGHIYNLDEAAERIGRSYGPVDSSELQLLEIGAGGDGIDAVGEHRIHYVRHTEVDVFTTPRVAARLRELLDQVETMYELEPARRRAAGVAGRD